jgi:hypothetical protein
MKRILFLISILVLATMACSVTLNMPEKQETGPSETIDINEAAPSETPPEVVIQMGAGKLELRGGGSDALIEGTVEYNVVAWKPEITRDGREVRISQGDMKRLTVGANNNIINLWDLRLGSMPLSLTIEAGAYESTLDLSGLALTSLRIADGAAKTDVLFDMPNPVEMDSFTYETGASSIKLEGLGFANFDEMSFKGGAGNYTLDFSGTLQRDADVYIDGGLGNFTVIVPKDTAARVLVEGGLKNVSPQGTWNVRNGEYRTEGTGPLLRIEVNIGVGNLTLISE